MASMGEVAGDSTRAGRFEQDSAVGLRARAARGTIVNGAFMLGGTALGLIQGTVVARLLPTAVIGRFELLMAAFMTLLSLGSVGVDDKYIQQNDEDQQRAFEIAFTMQWLVAGILAVLLCIGMPAFATIYGQPSIIVPGLALALGLPALVLQMPLWTYYRRMDFVRQRRVELLRSVVLFVAIVALIAVGLGLWALVAASLIASWVTAAFCVRGSPYRLRLRWELDAMREYRRFSWPLLVGVINTMVLWQVPVIVGARAVGVTAVAGIALALSVAQYTTRLDDIVTSTLYPAICAVKDRADLLFESFWKSNRLALLWAAPVGCAVALFAGDFVHYVIGEKWRFAVPLIAITGATAALNQIGFNWTAFFRATGETQPVAVATGVALVAMLAVGVPLLVTNGVTGFAVGLAIVTVIGIALRIWFLLRLFPGMAMARHVMRGLWPTMPAVGAVLLLRLVAGGDRTPARVVTEACAFAVLVVVATYVSERDLVKESVSYLRRRSSPPTAPV